MARAKYVEAKRELFPLKHVDEAKRMVFSLNKSIRFSDFIGNVRGAIIVTPTGDGGADLKLQVFTLGARMADAFHVPCADEEDFPFAFMEARKKILAKMDETSKSQKKFKIR